MTTAEVAKLHATEAWATHEDIKARARVAVDASYRLAKTATEVLWSLEAGVTA